MAVAVARARPGFDFIPALVGTGAGLAGGVLRTYATGLPAWRMGVYEAALIGVGVLGHFMDWNDDLSYGLQVAGAYGLAEQIAPALKGGNASLILSDVSAPSRAAPARASGATSHAGCSACAAAALRNPEVATSAAAAPARGYVPGQLQAPGPGPVYPAPKQEALGIL